MFESLSTTLSEIGRQFPVLVVALALGWYFVRYISRQHERELAAKNQEITRLLEEKRLEIERILDERRKYFQLFLKEIRSDGKSSGDSGDGPKSPAPR